jgi:hypothetical protein
LRPTIGSLPNFRNVLRACAHCTPAFIKLNIHEIVKVPCARNP